MVRWLIPTIFSLVCSGFFLFPLSAFGFGEPTFLNRQAFPLPLSLNESGRFHPNFLKTYQVLTQWNNPTINKVQVEIAFTFYDRDSGKNQDGEDGEDDSLMTLVEIFTIPDQIGHWGKSFLLTVTGEKLNLGFDHLDEGAALELYLDAQIIRVQHIEPQ